MNRVRHLFVASIALSSVAGLLQLRAEIPKAGKARLEQPCGAVIAEESTHAKSWRMKEIGDPAAHLNWRIERNSNHPEWPARLVQISDKAVSCLRMIGSAEIANGPTAMGGVQQMIVHKGDLVVIWEETPTLRAELVAVALSSGGLGDSIWVRLRFRGRVVQARVTAERRASVDRGDREATR